MSAQGLLDGRSELALSTGSRLTIETFSSRREGLPSGPTLRSIGKANWRTELEGEGLPTSPHATHDAVDFFTTELDDGKVILLVGDRFAFSLSASDGRVIGRATTHFTGRESLDVFFAAPSPDATRFVIASTKRISIFASSGEVLADEEISGLITVCSWVSPTTVAYESRNLDGLEMSLQSGILRT
jgi:hypothetical protein